MKFLGTFHHSLDCHVAVEKMSTFYCGEKLKNFSITSAAFMHSKELRLIQGVREILWLLFG